MVPDELLNVTKMNTDWGVIELNSIDPKRQPHMNKLINWTR